MMPNTEIGAILRGTALWPLVMVLGGTGMLLRDDLGGIMARRLLPAAILIPLLVGGAWLLGERLGLYGTTFGVPVFVLITMAAFLLVIVRNANALSRLETQHRDMEQRVKEGLRNSEERFRTAFEDAPIGMALVGLDGRFLNVNGSLCEIIGYSRKELLSKTFQDITYPDDLELDLANLHRLIQGEISSYQMEKRYFHKRGQLVTVLLTASAVRNAQNEPLYFISQIQDISERKQLEQAWRFLADAGPRLAASLESQTTLTTIAGLIVPELADWCVLELLGDDGRVHWVESMAAAPEKSRVLRELLTAYPYNPSRQGHIVADVLRTGQPALLPEIPSGMLEAAAEEAHHLELLRRLDLRSTIIAPSPLAGASWASSSSRHPNQDAATVPGTSPWPKSWPAGPRSPSTMPASTRSPNRRHALATRSSGSSLMICAPP
ncbi:PAS domain S-box protein [Archangium violaceum]|uniref:PAS domain S-box protein n=1 Tax=Archangium violaceum TaxID=83451 RepID=UPI000696E5C9|nr:PAS domain S-box protein [Archangium violaceum]